MLQNLPSIYVGHLLNPQTNDIVLDMCAAPGGKTTHIGMLMKNRGLIFALDKSRNKINQIQRNAERFGLTNIRAFVQDATKALNENNEDRKEITEDSKPLFHPESFDRILLDAPCSALGQRPQFRQKMKPKELESFSQLQKKLFMTGENRN